MDPQAMKRPAKLLIWRTGLDSTGLHEACTYLTLEAAISAAAAFLAEADAYPWIVTEGGEILTPQWVATYLDATPEACPAAPLPPRPDQSPAPRPVRRERGWLWFTVPRRPRRNPYRLAFAR